jgi:DMSO/TMAO reductase YedYZ molybdopterin-dependent catalytic subunit
MMHNPSRRDVLKTAPFAAWPALAGFGRAAEPASPFPGMIVRQTEPQNLEMPFASLDEWTVPNERFYIRSHFAVPKIDPKSFKLVVEGHVDNRLELSLDELKQFESGTRPLTLECAGNGRVFLTPAARGLQWGHGAVGNAEWTGTALDTLLKRAGIKDGAADVVLIGADSGALTADPATPGAIHFSRSLPLAKAKKPEVVIAWGMNGKDLLPSHGFPLRAVVGGWYGMASVKWLNRIVVTDRPYRGYFQTMDYSYYRRSSGAEPEVAPVTEIQPKAAIARPGPNEVIPAGKPYTVFGAAWAGESAVAKVELSTDGGKSWSPAKLAEKPKPFCWVKWSWEWAPAEKGAARLIARCTDEKGDTQPEKRDPNRRSYAINHWMPVEVLVR